MSQPVTTDSEQYIKNKSFDPTFQTSMVEAVGYDGSVLRPIAVDATGQVKLDPTNLDSTYLKLTQGPIPQQITGNAPDFTDGVLVSGGPLYVRGLLGINSVQDNSDAYIIRSALGSSHSSLAFGVHTDSGYTYIQSGSAGVSGVLQPLSFRMNLNEMMRLGTTGTLQLNAYTTNGFVKFTGSNGTLSVDTSTYALAADYVPYTGATGAVDLGAQNLSTTGDLTLGAKLIHAGDTDTFLNFTDNDINLTAGNRKIFDADTSSIVFNEDSYDIDFRIESNARANMFKIDAGLSSIGIASDPNDYSVIQLAPIIGDVAGSAFYLMNCYPYWRPTNDIAKSVDGINFIFNIDDTSATGNMTGGYVGGEFKIYGRNATRTLTSVTGGNFYIWGLGRGGTGGDITRAFGGRFGGRMDYGTIGTFYGNYIYDVTGAGAVTNMYGLYIENITKGGTLNYAIYSAGGDSYHAGTFQAGGFKSSDGTAGATGTITLASITTITVKNGLITAYS